MEPRRPIKELLTIMLENQHLFTTGLCDWCEGMHFAKLISYTEMVCMKLYIRNNKHTGFIWPWYRSLHYGFYWNEGSIKPRIKWIKKHIKKLS